MSDYILPLKWIHHEEPIVILTNATELIESQSMVSGILKGFEVEALSARYFAIHDLTVGTMTMFAGAGQVPGSVFCPSCPTCTRDTIHRPAIKYGQMIAAGMILRVRAQNISPADREFRAVFVIDPTPQLELEGT
jgi:hypothetical protein